ncbi:phospholipase A1 member A [Rhinophrynus dorsalis]
MAGEVRGRWELFLVHLILITSTVSGQNDSPTLKQCADFQTSGIFKDNQLQIQFILFTTHNPTCGQVIYNNESSSIQTSNFNASLGTKIIIHGFRALGTKPSWVDNMVEALLGAADVNVVAVDWVSGSTANYNQAVENIPKLSLEVVGLIAHLLGLGATKESIHLIGISLGAHAAGLVGQFHGGHLGRITGLDPAGFKFTKASSEERLDPGDAMFVEAIHTDTDNFGIRIPVGHIDYFINGGRDQPGCPSLRNFYGYLICDHMRSVSMYINAVRGTCTFIGFPCATYQDFHTGECLDCQGPLQSSCPAIGQETMIRSPGGESSTKEVQVFMMTTSKEPYCAYHILLEFTLTEPRDSNTNIEIKLKHDNSSSKAKISIPKNTLMGRAVIAHDLPLCKTEKLELKVQSSFWRKTPEISGAFCAAELPIGNSDRRAMCSTGSIFSQALQPTRNRNFHLVMCNLSRSDYGITALTDLSLMRVSISIEKEIN